MTGRPPCWFHDKDLDPEDEEMANLLLDLREGRTLADLRENTEESSGEEEETPASVLSEDGDDDETDTYRPPPTGQAPSAGNITTTNTSSASISTPGSVLPQGSFWKYQQPMAQPLGYRTAADANGGERTMTYAHNVDFNSRASVNNANKARAREVYRARVRYNLPLARESMQGREFTLTHFDWLTIAHEAYAILHNGYRIPWNTLTLWWNFCWTDNRTTQALRALESRNDELWNMRRGHPEEP